MDQHERADGEERREGTIVVLELLLEEAAAFAAAHVTPGRGAQLGQALGRFTQLEADVLTAHLARLGGLGQRDARPHEQRLHRGHRGLHRVGDLLIGERVDLAQQQSGALRLGQLVHVGDQLAEALAADHPIAGREPVLGEMDIHRVDADR